MERNQTLYELASFCKEEKEQECKKSDYKYGYSIIYIAIDNNDEVRVSRTNHILENAKKCFLIHSWEQKAVTQYYDTYCIQSINEKGEVLSGEIDDEYCIILTNSSWSYSATISLCRNGNNIYSAKLWENGINLLPKRTAFIFCLYKKMKHSCKTQFESELLGNLAEKEQLIEDLEKKLKDTNARKLFLEDEMKQLQATFAEIKSLLQSENH